MYKAHEIIDKANSEILANEKHQRWTQPLMLEYLNDGLIDIAKQAKHIVKTLSFDILPNTTTPFTIPTDLIKIAFVVNINSGKQIDVDRFLPTTSNEKEKILMMGSNHFIFNSDVDTRLLMTYYSTPDKVLKNSILEIPDYLSLGLVSYLAYRCYSKDQSSTNKESAMEHRVNYQQTVDEFSDIAFKNLQTEPATTSFQGF